MTARKLANLPLIVIMLLLMVSAQPAAAEAQALAPAARMTGGVNVFTMPPDRVCVGDSFQMEGAAGVTYIEAPVPEGSFPPLYPLLVTDVKIKANLGQVTPSDIGQPGDFFYFSFTYKAKAAGSEVITLTVNNGLATWQERFEVKEKCDYDAFLLTVMHYTVDLGDSQFRSLTHVTGTGTMKRDRAGSEFYQGDGTWHLQEDVLSKPPQCVQWYIPPLIVSGPFELDGHLTDEGDRVDAILQFLPKQGQSVYHGTSYCVDEDGNKGEGWGFAQGGDPSLASKIQTDFPVDGGTRTVELEGKGLEMVQSQGDLDYTATLTLIPR